MPPIGTGGVPSVPLMLTMSGFVARQLGALGLGAVEVADDDTCTDAARFFSYRRATLEGVRDYGRGLSAIALEG